MTYFADLARCDYFGPTNGLLAVGWLSREHAFTRGDIALIAFTKLAQLLVDPWQPGAFAGAHGCELCRYTGGPGTITVGGLTVGLGTSNVFVPASEAVYVAPSLVLHYMDAHGYAPPEPFLRAVEACPPMRSMPYLRAIRAHGIHRLATPRTDTQ